MNELREITDTDHSWLVELHNDPLVLRNITHPEPITMEQHLRWWARIKDRQDERRWIFTVGGVRAGLTKLYAFDETNRNCVLGADLHKDFRGRGLAKPMWRLLVDRAFGFGVHRISLTVADYNVPAHRVYTALGFQYEGKLVESLWRDGRFHDQHTMYLLRRSWK